MYYFSIKFLIRDWLIAVLVSAQRNIIRFLERNTKELYPIFFSGFGTHIYIIVGWIYMIFECLLIPMATL